VCQLPDCLAAIQASLSIWIIDSTFSETANDIRDVPVQNDPRNADLRRGLPGQVCRSTRPQRSVAHTKGPGNFTRQPGLIRHQRRSAAAN